MNLSTSACISLHEGIPRVSGDEPVIDHELIAGEQYSPRERG